MNRKQAEKYHKLLMAKRAELLSRLQEARASEKDGPSEDAPDLGDRAISTTSRDLNYRLTTGESEILKRIDSALGRIEAETFGECLNCGRKVQTGRLDAVPWAHYCIDCQELQDLGQL